MVFQVFFVISCGWNSAIPLNWASLPLLMMIDSTKEPANPSDIFNSAGWRSLSMKHSFPFSVHSGKLAYHAHLTSLTHINLKKVSHAMIILFLVTNSCSASGPSQSNHYVLLNLSPMSTFLCFRTVDIIQNCRLHQLPCLSWIKKGFNPVDQSKTCDREFL